MLKKELENDFNLKKCVKKISLLKKEFIKGNSLKKVTQKSSSKKLTHSKNYSEKKLKRIFFSLQDEIYITVGH